MADELDQQMKEFGYPGGGGGKSVSRETPSTSQETRTAPRYEDLDWQQKMGQGVAKNVAGIATGVPRLINKGIGLVSPGLSESLGDLAERIPGVKRAEEFAASPSEGGFETAGGALATGAELVAGPGEWKLGEKLASKFPTPTFAGGGKGFVPTPRPWVKTLGDVAESTGRGAVAGAIADPDDPGTGATIGAATGGLARPLGGLLRSEIGQMAAGHAARGTAWAAVQGLGHAIGVPAHILWAAGVPEAILFWHSPLGKMLHGGGRRAAELVGRALVKADPRIPAGASAKIADWLLSPTGQEWTQSGAEAMGLKTPEPAEAEAEQ